MSLPANFHEIAERENAVHGQVVAAILRWIEEDKPNDGLTHADVMRLTTRMWQYAIGIDARIRALKDQPQSRPK